MTADLEPIEALDATTLQRVAELFEAAGYGVETVIRAESVVPGQLDAVRMPLVHRALLDAGDPAALLACVFLYDALVPYASLGAALGRRLVDWLEQIGLARRVGDLVGSLFRITPVGASLVLSDRPDAGRDAVMPPGSTTGELLALLPPHVRGTCLDIGCGPGTLALTLARRGGTVTAVDVNRRACRTATINARLAGLAVEVGAGDLLAPVAGRRFDLIVSQPPWVARPDGIDEVTYLHGGARGDELLQRMLSALPGILEPNGVALVRFDAPVLRDDDVATRVGDALGGIGGLLVTTPGLSADHQAVGYASLADPTLGPAYRRAAVEYRSHLARMGVEGAVRCVALLTPASPVLHHLATQRLPADPRTLTLLASAQGLAHFPAHALTGARLATLPGTSVSSSPGRSDCTVVSPLGPPVSVGESVARIVAACNDGEPHQIDARDDLEAIREALRVGVLVADTAT